MTLHSKSRPLTIAITALLIATLSSSVVHAKRGHQGADRGNHQSVEQRFARLDISGDELLTLDEFTANIDEHTQNRFNRKDDDEDGFLTLEEATSNHRGEVPDHSEIASEIVSCVAALAEDNELIQVPDESNFASPEARFNDVDTSSDGLISLEELQDFKLSKALSTFESIDTDDSGDLSFTEFEAHSEQHRATRAAIRSCIQELQEDVIL